MCAFRNGAKSVGFTVLSLKHADKALVLLCCRSNMLKHALGLLCFRSNMLKNHWFYMRRGRKKLKHHWFYCDTSPSNRQQPATGHGSGLRPALGGYMRNPYRQAVPFVSSFISDIALQSAREISLASCGSLLTP